MLVLDKQSRFETVLFQLTETETEMSVNWNRSNPLTITVIETEIHAKTVIETELKYIVNNAIEIETEIYLITDTTLPSSPLLRVLEYQLHFWSHLDSVVCIRKKTYTTFTC